MSNDDTDTHYLQQYDAAAEADKFPLVRRWLDTEPLPFFKELREKRPILVTPLGTLLAHFDDVTEVLNLPKIFTVELYLRSMKGYLMSHDDDALHTREKSIMQGLLNRDDLPRIRSMVADIGKGILDKADKHIEVVNDYCRMVPATLVQDYFGLTGVDKRDLIEWSYWAQYDSFHNQPFDLHSDEKRLHIQTRREQTTQLLGKYIVGLILRRLPEIKSCQALSLLLAPWRLLQRLLGHKPEIAADDIVARMMRTSFPAQVDFDIKRLGANAGGLLIGAIETTSQSVAQSIQYLIDHPEWLAEAVSAAKAGDTEKFDGIVWETLRFVPLSSYLFRKSACEYTVAKGTAHATTIPAGSYVLPLTQSAMFDPKAFENPEQFNPKRNWYHHFVFGFGSHECMGKYIGMVLIPEMVRQVLLKPDIQAQDRIDYKEGPFPEHYELTWR